MARTLEGWKPRKTTNTMKFRQDLQDSQDFSQFPDETEKGLEKQKIFFFFLSILANLSSHFSVRPDMGWYTF